MARVSIEAVVARVTLAVVKSKELVVVVVVVVDGDPAVLPPTVRRGQTGGSRPERTRCLQQQPWRRSLWILEAAGRPSAERTREDKQHQDRPEDTDEE